MKIAVFDYNGKKEIVLERLSSDEISFGRGSNQDIIIKDNNTSRAHGLFRKKDGLWYVEDAGSTNGISINGKPLEGSCPLYTDNFISLSARNQPNAVRIDVVDDEYDVHSDRIHEARSTNRYLRMTSEQTEVLAQTGVEPVYESPMANQPVGQDGFSRLDASLQNSDPDYDDYTLTQMDPSVSIDIDNYPINNVSESNNYSGNYNNASYNNGYSMVNPVAMNVPKKSNKGIIIAVICAGIAFLTIILLQLIYIIKLNNMIPKEEETTSVMTEVTTEASTESAIPVDALEKLKEKSTDNKDTNKESGD